MFNLYAANSKVILTSELYTSRAAAEKGIASVQKNDPCVERFELRCNKNGEPYFVLKAANHEIIGTSESYSSTSTAKRGINSVIRNAESEHIRDRSK